MIFEIDALDALIAHLATVDMSDHVTSPTVTAYPRMLEGSDPSLSIGVFFMSWQPVDSPEIGSWEPTIGRYTFGVQTFLKSPDRAEGEAANALFVKRVRRELYRSKTLRDGLSAIAEVDDDGTVERYQRHGLSTVDYSGGAITGGFAFLSQSEFYLESEVA